MYGVKTGDKPAHIIEIPDIWTKRVQEKYIGRLLAGEVIGDMRKTITYSTLETEEHLIMFLGEGKKNKVASYFAGRKILGDAIIFNKNHRTKADAQKDMAFIKYRTNNFNKNIVRG